MLLPGDQSWSLGVLKKNFFRFLKFFAVFPMRFFMLNKVVYFVFPKNRVLLSPKIDL